MDYKSTSTSRNERLKALNAKKLELTLDEYYEQHVNSANKSVLELTLDEYYEHYVLPKLRAEKAAANLKKYNYKRTHYFRPNYWKQHQSNPKQRGHHK